MKVYIFVNETHKMTAKIISDNEDDARKLLPSGIEWMFKEAEG